MRLPTFRSFSQLSFSLIAIAITTSNLHLTIAHGNHGHSKPSHLEVKAVDQRFWESCLVYKKIESLLKDPKISKTDPIKTFFDTLDTSHCQPSDSSKTGPCAIYNSIQNVFASDSESPQQTADKILAIIKNASFAQSAHNHSHGHHHSHSHNHSNSLFKRASDYIENALFPKTNHPAKSAILATFYISLFPNLILLIIPQNLSPNFLRIMVSFAVGGLLGDVFLHLLPHIFSSSAHSHDSHSRNTILGIFIFVGLLSFMTVDKTMRLFGDGHSHSHSHSHSHAHSHTNPTATSTATASTHNDLRQRPSKSSSKHQDSKPQPESKPKSQQVQHSAYMNLIADATHNFTDGLAISSSFYISPAAGLSTFFAVFMHEIPHELGDFAILIQSGFSQWQALSSQFVTAIGAMLGAVTGVLIEEIGLGNSINFYNLITLSGPVFSKPLINSSSSSSIPIPILNPLLASFSSLSEFLPSSVYGVSFSELVIPFTAGGFIYIATVGVIPDLINPPPQSPSADSKSAPNLSLAAITETVAMLIVVGSVNGDYVSFFDKISKFNAKNGPFDSLLITGDFFGPSSYDLPHLPTATNNVPSPSTNTENSNDDLIRLLSNQISIPIPAFIIAGSRNLPSSVSEKVGDLSSGGEICSNLFYLGKSGIYKTFDGVRIAYLSGTETSASESTTDNQEFPSYNNTDIENITKAAGNQNAGSNASPELQQVDILISYQWPENVQTNSATPPALPHPPSPSSPSLSRLCLLLKPRYHFASSNNVFFEREPFRYDSQISRSIDINSDHSNIAVFTRFIGLGAFKGPNKSRWFYAMNITPLQKLLNDNSSKIQEPENTTDCPFDLPRQGNKRHHDSNSEINSYLFDNNSSHQLNNNQPPTLTKKMPPNGYICKICNVPGHYIQDCELKNSNNDNSSKRPKYDVKANCWFCLSNPKIDKNLIAYIGNETYLTMAKGMLIPTNSLLTNIADGNSLQDSPSADINDPIIPGGGHVLIIPIEHVSSTNTQIDSQSNLHAIKTEINNHLVSLNSLFNNYNCSAVSFSLIKPSSNMHIFTQVVPLPLHLVPKVKHAFHDFGMPENLNWSNQEPDQGSLNPNGGYVQVTLHGSDDSSSQPLDHIFATFDNMYKFDAQFGRRVLSSLLNIENGADWKSCVLSSDLEYKMTKTFASIYKPLQ
ncbi:CWF19-like protein 1-like protein [Smittium culicis]|uniref:CWF19-like protein 1-like protein n=1 Tax=Smittium culicis TaxID=133412 RepID=A0A1R1YTW9_9FUNG|nr:CWF19-like protein 1-like protein [Smittium culicis]